MFHRILFLLLIVSSLSCNFCSYLSQKEKAIFFLCRSSFRCKFSYRRHKKVFGDKSIVFLPFCENLGQATWLVINQLWFPERHFSANGISLRLSEVTNENLWEIVASSLFLGPSRLCCSLAQPESLFAGYFYQCSVSSVERVRAGAPIWFSYRPKISLQPEAREILLSE